MPKDRIVKRYLGGVVTIYDSPNGKNREYDSFLVAYTVNGERKRLRRKTLKLAKTEAEMTVVKFKQGQLDNLHLTGKSRDEYHINCSDNNTRYLLDSTTGKVWSVQNQYVVDSYSKFASSAELVSTDA